MGVELDVHEHMFAYAEAATLVLARRRPEVDAGVDRVLVDLGELVVGEVEVVERAEAVLELRDAARRRSAPR